MDLLNCYRDLSKLFYVFLALCQTKQSPSLTKISKLVEASALKLRCLMGQSTQCLGSVVPWAIFFETPCKLASAEKSMLGTIDKNMSLLLVRYTQI